MRLHFDGIPFAFDETVVDASPPAIERQVGAYEAGDRRSFDLGVGFPDSFTGEVMRAMAAIPYGERRTYGDLAADLDTSPIAVGQACGRNPVPVVVPCHRVVAADGLGGFSAGGDRHLDLKRALVAHEAHETTVERTFMP